VDGGQGKTVAQRGRGQVESYVYFDPQVKTCTYLLARAKICPENKIHILLLKTQDSSLTPHSSSILFFQLQHLTSARLYNIELK
jgi:hypothetical protein